MRADVNGASAHVSELAKIAGASTPVVSVYLDTRWIDEHQRDRARIFLKNELRRARAAGGAMGAPADLDWVEAEGRSLLEEKRAADTAGVALFACAALGVHAVIRVRVPFKEAFVVADAPYLRPLAAVAEGTPTTLVVFVAAASARLILVDAGGVGEEVTLESDVPGRHRQGGWALLAQSRYQRHIQEARGRHFEAVAQALAELSVAHAIARIVVAGETRTLAVFRKHVPPPLAELIVGGVPAAEYEPASDIVARATALLRRHEEEQEAAAADAVLTEAAKAGLAVSGLEATLEAVGRGAAHRCYILAAFREPGRACAQCDGLQPGAAERCRVCGAPTRPVELGEAIVNRVIATGGTVETVARHEALERAGGVAAMLRYPL